MKYINHNPMRTGARKPKKGYFDYRNEYTFKCEYNCCKDNLCKKTVKL